MKKYQCYNNNIPVFQKNYLIKKRIYLRLFTFELLECGIQLIVGVREAGNANESTSFSIKVVRLPHDGMVNEQALPPCDAADYEACRQHSSVPGVVTNSSNNSRVVQLHLPSNCLLGSLPTSIGQAPVQKKPFLHNSNLFSASDAARRCCESHKL